MAYQIRNCASEARAKARISEQRLGLWKRIGRDQLRSPKKEKDQLSLAQYRGETPLRTDPIPTAPGGWGLRNPEPKGPGQRRIFFSQASGAVDGRK